jgi:hypothetical protein
MSFFESDKFSYWESRIDTIFALKALNDASPLPYSVLSCLDHRAFSFLMGLITLYKSLNIPVDRDLFTGIPLKEDDLRVITFLLNNYFVQIGSNSKVVLLPNSICLYE